VLALIEEESKLPPDEVYVRCAEVREIPKEGTFKYIICMFKEMSQLLVNTK